MRRGRKAVNELTLADLARHPVWEYASDEEGEPDQDETTVRPVRHKGGPLPRRGGLIVSTLFEAADGTRYEGFCMPDPDGSIGVLQPAIITEAGQVRFWSGLMAPAPAELRRNYTRLAKKAPALFPLHFMARWNAPGYIGCGVLPAFQGLDRRDHRAVVLYR